MARSMARPDAARATISPSRMKARKQPFLADSTVSFLKRRAVEAGGFTLFALGLVLAIALLSYSSLDPSWNNAASTATTNWAGPLGAHAADFLLQTLGLGACVLTIVLWAWSWRLASHQGLPYLAANAMMLPVALLCTAMLAASLPVPEAWPLATGLGGVAGDFLFAPLGLLALKLGLPVAGVLAGLLTALLAVGALATTLGISREEWRQAVLGARWTGRKIWHGSVFAYGRIRRAYTWMTRAHLSIIDAAPRIGQTPAQHQEPLPEEMAPEEAMADDSANARVIQDRAKLKRGRRAKREVQPAFDLGAGGEYHLPALNLLSVPPAGGARDVDREALEANARLLESVLDDFGVKGEIVKVRPGPVVTLYELEPAPGTKSARVIGLASDIARSMSAVSARVAVVPGRNAIGIELPNAERENVYLGELLSTSEYERNTARLPLALGKDIGGAPVIIDLAATPHLLVAGTTGSGKSVGINAMILSLLFRLSPEECRFIMIDPKMLELSLYDGIPHLLAPVVTDPGKAVVALKWVVREMEDRYRSMSKLGVRNIVNHNRRLEEARKKGEVLKRTVQTGFDPETGKPIFEDQDLDLTPLPYIVVVVDEMADLMMVAGKDIEGAVQRLAQMARAAGIHLIMATQRPSVDVITGTIKANFPTRFSFQVTSKIDSRTILGEQGAEQLLGRGDMLYLAGGGRITRVHGPFVSEEETERIVAAMKSQGLPDYLDEVTEDMDENFGGFDPAGLGISGAGGKGGEEFYDQAVALVAREGKASTSFIQRHFQIGYNRAARIIEQMEAQGVVSKPSRAGKREVLVGEH